MITNNPIRVVSCINICLPQNCIAASKKLSMSPETNIIIAFDLYGTLLTTDSIAKKLADHFGQEKAASIAAVWRRYQLEYTWRLNSMSNSHP